MSMEDMKRQINFLLSRLRDEDSTLSRHERDLIDRKLEKLRYEVRLANYAISTKYGVDSPFDTLEERDSVYEE